MKTAKRIFLKDYLLREGEIMTWYRNFGTVEKRGFSALDGGGWYFLLKPNTATNFMRINNLGL